MSILPRLWAIWSKTDPDHLIATRHSEAAAADTALRWGGYVEPLYAKDDDR